MPLTPFHMGAALIVKPGLNKHFSLITFGIAQIAMDIEPGIGMLTGAEVLHGPSHTIVGALVIALLVMLVSPGICDFLLKRWNKEVLHYKLHWMAEALPVSKDAVIFGAFFGTLSHVLLDSLMHHDMRPLFPFSDANPLVGLITHDEIYQLCTIAGVLGAMAWITFHWIKRDKNITDVGVRAETTLTQKPTDFWKHWVRELRFTWLWVFILCLLPLLLWGSALFSIIVLTISLLIGLPISALNKLNNPSDRGWRRVVVMASVSFVIVSFFFRVDEQTPDRAAPIATAIESFRTETGQYPESLEMLVPKHLAEIPILRFSADQPRISYGILKGKPYLRIPSARGDQFANYEYDFESKSWIHNL